MNLSKLLAGLVAITVVSGCSEEQTFSADGTGQEVAITATTDGHAGASSRTTVGGIASDGHLVMQWEAEDKIGVFGTSTSNAPFTSTNATASNETSFSGTINMGDTPRCAYYPYAAEPTDVTAIPVTIPTEQTYHNESSVAKYDYKAASECVKRTDDTYHMQFRQMTSLLRLQINLRNADGLAVDEKLEKIEMTSEGGSLTGEFSYNLNALDNGLTEKDVQPSLVITMGNQPLLSQSVTAYAVVAPGTQNGKKADFIITTDKHMVKFSTTLLSDFTAGTFYDLPLNATVLANNDAVVEEIKEPEKPEAEETANCYMITATGEHSFLATQIGNGDKGIIPDAGFHVTSAAISPRSAKLLWQDTENFVSGISLKEGRVHYTANKNVGNALIAVYSGENCTGDILWSWHIWGVGDTLPSLSLIHI